MSKELGAGAWSYFGDPRAIHHDGHTFTGWISTTGNVWVADHVPGRRAEEAHDLQGPGARRPQQPVARVPPRRPHRRLLLAALGPPPAPSIRSAGCATGSACIRTRSASSAPCTRSTRTSPAASATRIRTRSSSATSCGCSGAGETGTRRSPTRGTAATGCRPASWSSSATSSGRTRSTSATAATASTASSPTAIRAAGRRACTTRATRTARSTPRAAAGSGRFNEHPAAHVQARPHLPLQRPRRAGLGPRHRARQGGPPVRRLHAPLTTARATPSTTRTSTARAGSATRSSRPGRGRPSYTSGGATLDHEDPRIVYLSRRIGTWFQVESLGRRPTAGATGCTHQLTDDPNGYAIRPVTPRGLREAAQPGPVRPGDNRTIGYRDYRTRIHALEF